MRDGLAELTGREREVMALAAEGHDDEIAARLCISTASALSCVAKACLKLRLACYFPGPVRMT